MHPSDPWNISSEAQDRYQLYRLEELTSQALMDKEMLVCPICGAPALRTYLRAGLADFVAALLCLPCRVLFRAADTFSLAE